MGSRSSSWQGKGNASHPLGPPGETETLELMGAVGYVYNHPRGGLAGLGRPAFSQPARKVRHRPDGAVGPGGKLISNWTACACLSPACSGLRTLRLSLAHMPWKHSLSLKREERSVKSERIKA